MDRRNAIKSMLALFTAPAIIKVDMLMKVKPYHAPIATDFNIEYSAKIISVANTKSNFTIGELYEWLKYQWDDESESKEAIPMVPVTPQRYVVKDGWSVSLGDNHLYNDLVDLNPKEYSKMLQGPDAFCLDNVKVKVRD